ncbi:hypothetical protein ASG90_03040 [Nocardioides sp. Soil797]|nr:hypothetical protein ASG90_03040 [Nocardioides sp. Soil797]
MTRRTSLPMVIACLVAGLLLGGCNVNAGDQAVDDFEGWWDGHATDGVEITHTQANNDLPFSGSGDIWLRPDESVDTRSLVDDLCGYDADKETVFHLDSADAPESTDPADATGERDVEVAIDCDDTDLTMTQWETLLETDGLASASIDSRVLVARFDSPEELLAAVADLRELDPSELHLSSGEFNAPGHLSVDQEGDVTEATRALLDAVLDSGVPLRQVDAGEHHRSGVELEVVVDGDQSDVDRLEELLLEVDPQAADLATITPAAG